MFIYKKSIRDVYEELYPMFSDDENLEIYYYFKNDYLIYYDNTKTLKQLKNNRTFSNEEACFYLIKIKDDKKLKLKKITDLESELEINKKITVLDPNTNEEIIELKPDTNKIIAELNILQDIFFNLYPENKYMFYSKKLSKEDINNFFEKINKAKYSLLEILDILNTYYSFEESKEENEEIKKLLEENDKKRKFLEEKNIIEKYDNDFLRLIDNFIPVVNNLKKEFFYSFLKEIPKEIMYFFLKAITFIHKPIEIITPEDIKEILNMDINIEQLRLINEKEKNLTKKLKKIKELKKILIEIFILKSKQLSYSMKEKIFEYYNKNNKLKELEEVVKEREELKKFFKSLKEDTYGDFKFSEILKILNEFIEKKEEIEKKKVLEKLITISEESILEFCFNDFDRISIYHRFFLLEDLEIFKNKIKKIMKNNYSKIFSGKRFIEIDTLKLILEDKSILKDYSLEKDIEEKYMLAKIFREYNFINKNIKNSFFKSRYFKEKIIDFYFDNKEIYLGDEVIQYIEWDKKEVYNLKENHYYLIFKEEKKYLGRYIKSIKMQETEILLFVLQENFIENFIRKEVKVYKVIYLKFAN